MNINNLIQEIEMRYRFMQYKKLHKRYLFNRMEKNNVHLLYDTAQELLIKLAHLAPHYHN